MYLRSLGLLNCQLPSCFFRFCLPCSVGSQRCSSKIFPAPLRPTMATVWPAPEWKSTRESDVEVSKKWSVKFQYNPNWKTPRNLAIVIQKNISNHWRSLKILSFCIMSDCAFSLQGTYCEAETSQDHSIWPHRIKEAHILQEFLQLRSSKLHSVPQFWAPQRKCCKAHHPCPHHLCCKTLLVFCNVTFRKLPTFICWNVRFKVDDLKPLQKHWSQNWTMKDVTVSWI